MRAQSGSTAHLVVLVPESDQGRRIALAKDYLVVGREQICDVCFDDPQDRGSACRSPGGNSTDLGSCSN
jgi:hypothetical protein